MWLGGSVFVSIKSLTVLALWCIGVGFSIIIFGAMIGYKSNEFKDIRQELQSLRENSKERQNYIKQLEEKLSQAGNKHQVDRKLVQTKLVHLN